MFWAFQNPEMTITRAFSSGSHYNSSFQRIQKRQNSYASKEIAFKGSFFDFLPGIDFLNEVKNFAEFLNPATNFLILRDKIKIEPWYSILEVRTRWRTEISILPWDLVKITRLFQFHWYTSNFNLYAQHAVLTHNVWTVK